MWCNWDTPFSPPLVFDGGTWKPRKEIALTGTLLSKAMTDRESSEELRFRPDMPREFIATFSGIDGAMIFEDLEHRFHLFDAEGHVLAESAEQLALTYPDRLRKALPYPPRQITERCHHLVKDANGRIWWAQLRLVKGASERIWWPQWREEWGVVDGRTAIRGEIDDLKKQVPGGQFTILCPIGDGTRVFLSFLGFREGLAGIYGVEKGRIVRLADSPVTVVELLARDPQTAVQADNSGRLWCMRDRDEPGSGSFQPVSQILDSRGKPAATHRGFLILEDRKKGLWFKQTRSAPACIMRLDADGHDVTLEVPDLTDSSSFAEAPDGSVWMLTRSELARIRTEGDRLSIVELYPMSVQDSDTVWCDSEGRVWMMRTLIDHRDPPHKELIRYATASSIHDVSIKFHKALTGN